MRAVLVGLCVVACGTAHAPEDAAIVGDAGPGVCGLLPEMRMVLANDAGFGSCGIAPAVTLTIDRDGHVSAVLAEAMGIHVGSTECTASDAPVVGTPCTWTIDVACHDATDGMVRVRASMSGASASGAGDDWTIGSSHVELSDASGACDWTAHGVLQP